MVLHGVMDMLKQAALVDFGIQGVAYLVAAALKTEKFYDLTGTGTVLFVTLKSLQWGRSYFLRQYVQSTCASVWAIRLGLFLFIRVLRDGGDSRFDGIKGSPLKFLAAWMMQGVWIFTNILPTIIQNSKREDRPIGWREYVGWGIWVLGFVIEAVADQQKYNFKSDPTNHGKFITHGLWSMCRYPNYLGEIMMWSGLYVSASRSLRGWEHLSIVSPLFSAFLLTQVSGIPIHERRGMKRWGHNPEYLKYLAETPKLIPNIFKLFK